MTSRQCLTKIDMPFPGERRHGSSPISITCSVNLFPAQHGSVSIRMCPIMTTNQHCIHSRNAEDEWTDQVRLCDQQLTVDQGQ